MLEVLRPANKVRSNRLPASVYDRPPAFPLPMPIASRAKLSFSLLTRCSMLLRPPLCTRGRLAVAAPVFPSVLRRLRAQRLPTDIRASPTVGPPLTMKKLEELKFESVFTSELPGDKETKNGVRQVNNAFYSFVNPTPPPSEPYLVSYSEDACALLGLDREECQRPEFPLIMSGQAPIPGTRPYAQCYGGHQFGMWAGQLGDGRVINLGEVLNQDMQRWEIQLKGVGRTPFSRFADGRAVMRSSIREFVASEALHYLGVPTTRALCVVGTGDTVERDMFYNGDPKLEPGAAVCRLAPCFVRFGTFQLPASREGQTEMVVQLADWVIKHHFPEFEGEENKYEKMLFEVCERTGTLVAGWQSVGFVHGVMNTDNMSILGLTIDYGPYGFLDKFDPEYTPNITDLKGGGRYCYKNQPDVCQWNLYQLSMALMAAHLVEKEAVIKCLERYDEVFSSAYTRSFTRKFGLEAYDRDLAKKFMQNMYDSQADFTNAFRALSCVTTQPPAGQTDDHVPQELWAAMGEALTDEQKIAWREWVGEYRRVLQKENVDEAKRVETQNSANPKFIPRQHLLQWAIEGAEKGDYSELESLMAVLRKPFDEHPGMEKYSQPPPEDMVRPGVSMLSCSS